MKNGKNIVWLILLFVITIALNACGAPTDVQEATTYNNFSEFIPYIPGAFPDDFDLDGANTGTFEENGQAVYWEIYTGADGRYFLILQRGRQEEKSPPTSSLLIQNWEADLSQVDAAPDIPELAALDMENTLRLSALARTKSDIPIQLEIISNASEAELIEFGEMMTPSICLSTPTPTE